MKRIFAIAASSIVLSTSAYAYTDAPATLVSEATSILAQNGYGDVDAMTLTDAQISEIYLIGTSTDNANDLSKRLMGVMEASTGAAAGDSEMTTDANSAMMSKVIQDALDQYGLNDVSADGLSDAQRAGIYLAATSEPEATKENKIRSLVY